MLAEMDHSIMEVISPSRATAATPQTTELRKLMAEVTCLKKQLLDLKATKRRRSNNGSNRSNQYHSPSLHTSRQQTGKCLSQQLGATSAADPTQSCLFYSTDQMQGISLMHLSLVTNAFIADNERIYH